MALKTGDRDAKTTLSTSNSFPFNTSQSCFSFNILFILSTTINLPANKLHLLLIVATTSTKTIKLPSGSLKLGLLVSTNLSVLMYLENSHSIDDDHYSS